MCSKISWCFGRTYFVDNLKIRINEIEDETIKSYLLIRYLRVVKRLEELTKRTSFLYYIFSLNVTLGSLVLPPLLTIKDKNEDDLFWSIFAISLLVTCSNAIIKLFQLDKTYVTRHVRINQFKSEGMMYLSKIAPYNIEDETARFRLFVRNFEKYKREQVFDEYNQNGDEIPVENDTLTYV